MNIESVLTQMTLKDKICQATQIPYNKNEFETLKERIKKECIGSIILATNATAGNTKQDEINLDKINELQQIAMEYHGIPLLVGRDVIHGHHVCFPVPLAMSASFNPKLMQESYACIAEEAKNDGINWSFAPMLDISRDPRWGRIIESPGEDPYLGEKMAEAVVKGFQGDGDTINIAACAKHYIGYGATEGGRDYHKAEISDYSMRNYYLKPFDAAVKSGCATVMNSFSEVSGEPVASSRYLLTDVLRGELGFNGFVISDWEAIYFLQQQGVAKDKQEAANLAINAGIDMDMVDNCYYDTLEQSVANGAVSIEVLDEAVRRILQIKDQLGLFENPYIESKDYSIESHRQKAKEMACESVVLLKNQNAALPIGVDERICVLGEMAKDKRSILGSWSLDYDINESVSVLEGIKSVSKNAVYYDYFTQRDTQIASSDTAIVVIGEHFLFTGEARATTSIELSERDKELIRTARKFCKKVIGVLNYARPMALESVADLFDAILYSWHSGSQTGAAVADIVFGRCSPSGKLPVTLPRVTGQIPIYYNCTPPGKYTDFGYYTDQARPQAYCDCLPTPMYPFGFGLNYGEFEYSSILVEKESLSLKEILSGESFVISLNVKNLGTMKAKETVQCYVRDCYASMVRPIKELKAFDKQEYQPGETKQISFKIGMMELGFYRRDGKFAVEPGEFRIYIGSDCTQDNYVTVMVGE